jgi:hypothetical protein
VYDRNAFDLCAKAIINIGYGDAFSPGKFLIDENLPINQQAFISSFIEKVGIFYDVHEEYK